VVALISAIKDLSVKKWRVRFRKMLIFYGLKDLILIKRNSGLCYVRCRYLYGKDSFNVLKRSGMGYLKLKDMGADNYTEVFDDGDET